MLFCVISTLSYKEEKKSLNITARVFEDVSFFFLAKRRMYIDDLTVPPAETYYLKRNVKAKYSHEQAIDVHSVTYEWQHNLHAKPKQLS